MRTDQKAFVLKSVDKGENSRLVTLLTEYESIREITLHGYKSRKSENKALMQTGNLLLISTELHKNKIRLLTSELINNYPLIKKDLDKINFLASCYKSILNLPYDLKNDLRKHFQLLTILQQELETNQVADYRLLELYFYYSLTYCFGIRPDRPLTTADQITTTTNFYFEPDTGRISAERQTFYDLLINTETAGLFDLLYNSRMPAIMQSRAEQESVRTAKIILKKYFKHHLNTIPE